jgi:uncharacterized membrane protein YvlD (DUF360 family)
LRQLGYAFWDPLTVVASPDMGRRHLLSRILTTGAIEAVAFLVTVQIVRGLDTADVRTDVAATLLVATLNALLRPALLRVTLSITVLSLGLFSFVLNALVLVIAAWLIPGFTVDGFWAALLGAIVLATVNFLLATLFHVSDDDSFYLSLVRKAAKRRGGARDRNPHPGLVVISIDGLGEPVLRFAVRTGAMPTLARWIREGSHSLHAWECQLPSQTSASQAGLLHGTNFDIPAFRWYEKDSGRHIVSNVPADTTEIARRLSDGSGLLATDGTTVATLFSGDAARTPLVMAHLQERTHVRPTDFYGYLVNPYSLTRTLLLSGREFVRELAQARRQRSRDVRPRVDRDLKFAFLRAGANVLMRDLTTSAVIDNMYAGAPIIYANYLAYDEVAHHAGPERPEALEELGRIDDTIAAIERAEQTADRDYHFVVLSDHGQSQGATFRQRFGCSLDEYVRDLVGAEHSVAASVGTNEEWGTINAMTTEGVSATNPTARRALTGAMKPRMADGVAVFGPDARDRDNLPGDATADVVVAASGNLANVYFAEYHDRLTLEQIERHFPRLLSELAAHPGIGFLLVHSSDRGALAIGPAGVHRLDDDTIEGDDPLAGFGPHAPDHLRRLDAFPHVGDVVVNSAYNPSTEEVAAFEELVGSHGGLGGPQVHAFLLYPAGWPCPDELIGAPAVHEVLCNWRDQLTRDGNSQGSDHADAPPPDDAARPREHRSGTAEPARPAPDATPAR